MAAITSTREPGRRAASRGPPARLSTYTLMCTRSTRPRAADPVAKARASAHRAVWIASVDGVRVHFHLLRGSSAEERRQRRRKVQERHVTSIPTGPRSRPRRSPAGSSRSRSSSSPSSALAQHSPGARAAVEARDLSSESIASPSRRTPRMGSRAAAARGRGGPRWSPASRWPHTAPSARPACSAPSAARAGSRRTARRGGCVAAANPNSEGRPSVISLPRRGATVVAAVHADVVLLVEAELVDGRPDELVDAEAELGVPERPVGAEARGCGASTCAPSSVVSKIPTPWTIAQNLRRDPSGMGEDRRHAEMAGRLACLIVPVRDDPRLAVQRCLSSGPGGAPVACSRRCRPPPRPRAPARARGRQARDLRQPGGAPRRRRRGLRSTAPTSRRGRRSARPRRRATRSQPRRRDGARRRIVHRMEDGPGSRRTGRGSPSRAGRRRSRARKQPFRVPTRSRVRAT